MSKKNAEKKFNPIDHLIAIKVRRGFKNGFLMMKTANSGWYTKEQKIMLEKHYKRIMNRVFKMQEWKDYGKTGKFHNLKKYRGRGNTKYAPDIITQDLRMTAILCNYHIKLLRDELKVRRMKKKGSSR